MNASSAPSSQSLYGLPAIERVPSWHCIRQLPKLPQPRPACSWRSLLPSQSDKPCRSYSPMLLLDVTLPKLPGLLINPPFSLGAQHAKLWSSTAHISCKPSGSRCGQLGSPRTPGGQSPPDHFAPFATQHTCMHEPLASTREATRHGCVVQRIPMVPHARAACRVPHCYGRRVAMLSGIRNCSPKLPYSSVIS